MQEAESFEYTIAYNLLVPQNNTDITERREAH